MGFPPASAIGLRPLARPLRFLKNSAIYYSVRALLPILDVFPYKSLQKMGDGLGALVFYFFSTQRKKTLAHLALAYPGEDEKKRRGIGLGAWKNAGRSLLEILRWRNWGNDRVMTQVSKVEGLEKIEEALKKGKGVLAVTAHLGNWETLVVVGAKRFPGKMTVVTRPLYDPRMDRLVTGLRAGKGVEVVQRGLALRGILGALQQNHIVGLLMDQDTGRDGVFTPFFGRLAWTQTGAARIAIRTGAAMFPAFILREEDGRYRVQVDGEIKVPRTGDEEKDVLETVRRYTEAIEARVREKPEQWVWMHERWKTRPAGEKTS